MKISTFGYGFGFGIGYSAKGTRCFSLRPSALAKCENAATVIHCTLVSLISRLTPLFIHKKIIQPTCVFSSSNKI
jgi:hypothetical protein